MVYSNKHSSFTTLHASKDECWGFGGLPVLCGCKGGFFNPSTAFRGSTMEVWWPPKAVKGQA